MMCACASAPERLMWLVWGRVWTLLLKKQTKKLPRRFCCVAKVEIPSARPKQEGRREHSEKIVGLVV